MHYVASKIFLFRKFVVDIYYLVTVMVLQLFLGKCFETYYTYIFIILRLENCLM